MIYLITGQPGAGKTLFTLDHVRQRAQKESRQVYYSGIKDLRLPWTELDAPENWPDVPTGAIVVIDECQRVFRPRTAGSGVPRHVSELETHRHKGIDIYLITQDPMLADVNIRRLVGTHFHVLRAFGSKFATVHEWNSVRLDPDKPGRREDSIKHQFKYPIDIFQLYHSAEVHTHQRKIPARLIFLFVLPVLIGVLIYLGYGFLSKSGAGSETKAAPPSLATTAEKPTVRQEPTGTMTTAELVDSYTPRVAGLPFTAPRYDRVTEAVEAPIPMCISNRSKCRCYTQQGTRLDTPEDVCRSIAERGLFVDWRRPEARLSSYQAEPMRTAAVDQIGPGARAAGGPHPEVSDGVAANPIHAVPSPGGAYRSGWSDTQPRLR